MSTDISKICFVIAPIGDPNSEIRKRSDILLEYVIQPTAEDCGYKAIRADKISEPGAITRHILELIIEAPMVIADLTGGNPNVFYELAVRHTFRKPYVMLIQRGERIPFDVAAFRTIEIDLNDIPSYEAAKVEIKRQIKASEGKDSTEIDSPISVVANLQALRQSNNPEHKQLADIFTILTELSTEISTIKSALKPLQKQETERQEVPQGQELLITLRDVVCLEEGIRPTNILTAGTPFTLQLEVSVSGLLPTLYNQKLITTHYFQRIEDGATQSLPGISFSMPASSSASQMTYTSGPFSTGAQGSGADLEIPAGFNTGSYRITTHIHPDNPALQSYLSLFDDRLLIVISD